MGLTTFKGDVEWGNEHSPSKKIALVRGKGFALLAIGFSNSTTGRRCNTYPAQSVNGSSRRRSPIILMNA